MVIPPITVPTVTLVAAAPLTSVVAVGGVNYAEPVGVTVQVTWTPWTGCPLDPSATKLSGNVSAAPVGAVSLSPAIPVTEAACGPVPVLSPPHAANAPKTKTARTRVFMMPPLFGHDAVEYLAVSDHAELLPRHALLHRGIRLQVVRQLGQ